MKLALVGPKALLCQSRLLVLIVYVLLNFENSTSVLLTEIQNNWSFKWARSELSMSKII